MLVFFFSFFGWNASHNELQRELLKHGSFMTCSQNKPRNAFISLDLQVRCLQGYWDMHISTASTSLKYLNSSVIPGNCSTRQTLPVKHVLDNLAGCCLWSEKTFRQCHSGHRGRSVGCSRRKSLCARPLCPLPPSTSFLKLILQADLSPSQSALQWFFPHISRLG